MFRTRAKNHRFVQCEKCNLSYIKFANITPPIYNCIQNEDGRSFQSCIDSTLLYTNIEDFDKNFGIVDDECIETPEKSEEMNLNKIGPNIAHLNINGIRSRFFSKKNLISYI